MYPQVVSFKTRAFPEIRSKHNTAQGFAFLRPYSYEMSLTAYPFVFQFYEIERKLRVLCPVCNQANNHKPSIALSMEYSCSSCLAEFCVECWARSNGPGQTIHHMPSCPSLVSHHHAKKMDSESLALVQKLGFKPCPVCGIVIERISGCYHMSVRVVCLVNPKLSHNLACLALVSSSKGPDSQLLLFLWRSD